MIKLLNFIYRGLEYADPRYGPKGAFWLTVFSLVLCPLDTAVIGVISRLNLSSLNLVWILLTMLVRLFPIFYVKPLVDKYSRLYAYDKSQTYIVNAIIAFTIIFIFVPFPIWLVAILNL